MADDFVEQDLNRHAVLLGQVESADGLFVDFLAGCRNQGDGRVVTVGAPLGLHDVRLAGAGRHAGRRAATHNVNDDAGSLGDAGIADQFLLEGDAGTRGRGQRLGTGQRCADDRSHGSDFVFHLNELPSNLRKFDRHNLGNFRGGGDGVTTEECAAGVQRAHSTCVVPL